MLGEKLVKHLTRVLVLVMIVFSILLVYLSKNQTLTVFQATITPLTYVDEVFNKETMLEIDIQISEENWNQMIENATTEQYVMADIVINGETFSSVGIRPKGNSSLSMVASDDSTDRYSFKVKFSKYIEDQSLYGLDKLVLNNMIGDATYMKEYLSYEMFSAMGIATPAYTFANISINGEPWGVYLALEAMEESFVQRSFGSLNGNLYKPESVAMGGAMGGKEISQQNEGNFEMTPPQMGETNGEMPAFPGNEDGTNMTPQQMGETNGEIPSFPGNREGMNTARPQMGGRSSSGTNLVYIDDDLSSYSAIFDNSVLKKTTEKEYYKVIEMIRNLNAGTNLETYLDVEEILRYFAVNTFLVNLDSYAGNMKHNYYLYEEDGVFQILPWDFNLSFGAFELSDASKAINFPIDQPVTDMMENSPLISKLLEVEEYKEMYHQYLQELIEVYIESGRYEETIDKVNQLIKEAIANDATAFYTYEEYQASLPNLVQFGIDRSTSIKAQLAGDQPSESYGNIETTVNLTAMGSQNGTGGAKGGREDGEFMKQKGQSSLKELEDGLNREDELNQESSSDRIMVHPDGEVKDVESVEIVKGQESDFAIPNQSVKQILTELVAKHPQLSALTSSEIQHLISKLSGKTVEMLTDEELDLFSTYQIDPDSINTILNLINQIPNRGMSDGINSSFQINQLKEEQMKVIGLYMGVLVLGILGVSSFKKRKYTS